MKSLTHSSVIILQVIMSVLMSAILCRMTWFLESVFPKVSRSEVYFRVISKAYSSWAKASTEPPSLSRGSSSIMKWNPLFNPFSSPEKNFSFFIKELKNFIVNWQTPLNYRITRQQDYFFEFVDPYFSLSCYFMR